MPKKLKKPTKKPNNQIKDEDRRRFIPKIRKSYELAEERADNLELKILKKIMDGEDLNIVSEWAHKRINNKNSRNTKYFFWYFATNILSLFFSALESQHSVVYENPAELAELWYSVRKKINEEKKLPQLRFL